MYFGGEIDHIVSQKHGGLTSLGNLAFACQPCNRRKGTDFGSILKRTGELVRFFDPRSDSWSDHFSVLGSGEIGALSDIGQVTIKLLGLNDIERVAERKGLIEIARYPVSGE